MKHWTTYPLLTHPLNPEFASGEGIRRFVLAAEAAGFDGIAFTDHPAPSHKWLNGGGHDALDPFAALSFVAGVTERIRLSPTSWCCRTATRSWWRRRRRRSTRSPTAGSRCRSPPATSAASTAPSGSTSSSRNVLFDEALAVLKGAWTTDEFGFEGSGFTASGISANPKPAHVPIWIGGNSALTRRRVAEHGDGWNPFPAPAWLAKTSRTVPLEGLDDLAPMLDHLRRHTEAAGRDPSTIDVAFTTGEPGAAEDGFSADAHLEGISRMAALGVTWNSTTVPGDSMDGAVEALERYGARGDKQAVVIKCFDSAAGAVAPARWRHQYGPVDVVAGVGVVGVVVPAHRGGGAAVDVEGLAGDVARQRRREEHRRARRTRRRGRPGPSGPSGRSPGRGRPAPAPRSPRSR